MKVFSNKRQKIYRVSFLGGHSIFSVMLFKHWDRTWKNRWETILGKTMPSELCLVWRVNILSTQTSLETSPHHVAPTLNRSKASKAILYLRGEKEQIEQLIIKVFKNVKPGYQISSRPSEQFKVKPSVLLDVKDKIQFYFTKSSLCKYLGFQLHII